MCSDWAEGASDVLAVCRAVAGTRRGCLPTPVCVVVDIQQPLPLPHTILPPLLLRSNTNVAQLGRDFAGGIKVSSQLT